VTLTQPLHRYTIEAAAIWLLGRHGRLEPFARGGAGWMRQITDDKVLVDDSIYIVAGGGVRYWMRPRFGLRVDGAAIDRLGDLTFGTRRVAGIVGGGVIFGF